VRTGEGSVTFNHPGRDYPESDFIPIPCKKGTLVLIHGCVVHRSSANKSDNSRIIYTFHMIEGPPTHTYDELNWLQPTAKMPFTPLYTTMV